MNTSDTFFPHETRAQFLERQWALNKKEIAGLITELAKANAEVAELKDAFKSIINLKEVHRAWPLHPFCS